MQLQLPISFPLRQSPKLWTLPHELILLILGYLEIHELQALEVVPQIKQMFTQSRNKTIVPLYREITNLMNEKDYQTIVAKIEQIWTRRKIISLPFWGFKTDGGVLHHSIPFWIGKAFLKTDHPIVGLASMNTGCFSGCISQDYYQFSNIVASLSKLLGAIYQNQQFREDIHQIDLKYVIMEAFHAEIEDATQQQREKFQQLRSKLYNYARRVGHFLQQQTGLVMKNNDVITLPLTANLHTVEISRALKPQIMVALKNCIQTLVIGTKTEIPFKVLEKMDVPEIAHTNLTKQQLKKFTFGYKPTFTADSEAKYIMFKPNEQGILLWLDFGSDFIFKKTIPYDARVWANQVHVCMIRGQKEREPYGLCLSYIQFKGIMI